MICGECEYEMTKTDDGSFECHDPDPNLTVLAYPTRYRNNPTLAHLYSKRMPYGMVSAGYSIRIGMIENGEVKGE